MYGLIPLFMIPIFILWVAFHFFIKKDLMKHKDILYGGLIFVGIWAVIYIAII